jgi:thiamine transport system substrate-binding protein
MNSWGPGPWVAQEFKRQSGIDVKYQDGGDAGLLLAKLRLFPSDVVVGLDQFGLDEAKGQFEWKSVIAIDWAPLTFVFRRNETAPPHRLDDLLDSRFKNKISLEDPRTSSPGLQFLFWVLDIKGIKKGFDYLKALKPNVRAVSPSWSSAYGLFQKHQADLVFSYLTSPIYHWINEKGPEARSYSAAVFEEGLPIQTEYAVIAQSSPKIEAAQKFLVFLQSPEVQKKLMLSNYMFPVTKDLTEQTRFSELPTFEKRNFKNYSELLKSKKELLEKWQELEL